MRLFRREEEGGITVADWDDGFVALCKNETRSRFFRFQFERWSCCPGAYELNVELMGLMFVVYSEGGPCQLDAYLDEVNEPSLQLTPAVPASRPVSGGDWQSVPTAAASS